MKLSFSTRGYESISWSETVELAHKMEFQGIELFDPLSRYDLCNENISDKPSPLSKNGIRSTERELRAQGLFIPAIDSALDLSSKDDCQKELRSLIDKAYQLNCAYISVLALKEYTSSLFACLDAILPYASKHEVCILVETQGASANTEYLNTLLDHFASDHLAALWNVNHTYRDQGEKPSESVHNLGDYIRHVHLHDSDKQGALKLIGEGTLPISHVMQALASINYSGFISLVWNPEHIEGLDNPEVVFPYFVNYMSRFSDTSCAKRCKLKNHNGLGEYIWEKNELIDCTFSEVLDRLVNEFPDQCAFKYTTLNYTRTYKEFRDDVDNFARGLVSLGVKPGSKVAIWATNVPAWFITFWAVTKIGAVLVSVNTAYKVHEAEYLFRQSDTHTIVMIESALDSNYKEIISSLCPELAKSIPGQALHCKKLPFLRNVISVGFDMPGAINFDSVFERASFVPLAEINRMASTVKPDDVCNMQYTSGTTGFPKGVMLTHRSVINDGKCIGDRMDLSTADRMMIQVPMFHCFGMVLSMTSSMTHGATMCPMPYFSAKTSLSCITQERITAFNGVPTMFVAMFNHPDYMKTDFSHMRTGIMAGSGCPTELMLRAAKPDEMNMTGIVSVYGQTEASPGCTMSEWTDPLWLRTETVGYAFSHVECKVIDPHSGEVLSAGSIGEFCSRGYNTMKGYYKMPEETSQAIDEQGWLHSGDLGYFDKDGNLKITGRLKDMIIRGGENIYPMEIEEFLHTHPAVQDVQVVGVPDEKYGEEAVACVLLKKNVRTSEKKLRDYMNKNIARHKVPKYIEFVDAFPMNAAGKVLKFKLRDIMAKKLELDKQKH